MTFQPGNAIVHVAKCDSPIVSMTVHPAETWIITHHLDQSVCIWDYITQEKVENTFRVLISKHKADVLAPIFVARKQWYLTGTNTGHVKVYSYETMEDVKTFKAHDDNVRSLDIHPTKPYLLSASYDKRIKLWIGRRAGSVLKLLTRSASYLKSNLSLQVQVILQALP
jgi:coatomer subunit beta'